MRILERSKKLVELNAKVESLHDEIFELHKRLEDKADKERLRLIEKEKVLRTLTNTLSSL